MKNPVSVDVIKSKIFFMRGQQVILDREISVLYGVETRALKQAVKRNYQRFPSDFMFKLTKDEINILVSQNVIPDKKITGGAIPFVFTEQGVACLSSILKSKVAIEVNIEIMRAFVLMRKIITNNALIYERLDKIERKQLEADEKFEKVFKAIESKCIIPEQGIFFDGQIYDAYIFSADLIRSAKKSLLLIDNYIDDTVLTLMSKRKKGVTVEIFTNTISKQLALDLKKHNEQYSPIQIKELKNSHDRFLIIDNIKIYHIGASLKDLGKKWFAFSVMDESFIKMILDNVVNAAE